MKKIRPLRLIAATAACILFTVAALADSALVVTPKGPLNLRKSPTTDSNRIASIPNGETIEVLDVDGDWAKATYNGKTGFVMTKFLRIESQLAGKTVYPDDYGLVMLRKEPSASAVAVVPVDNISGMPVEAIENGWVSMKLDDETTLYAPSASFVQQTADAPKSVTWMAEGGETARDVTMQVDGGSSVSLPKGTPLTVTMPYNGNCLVITEEGCGFLPMGDVLLWGPENSDAEVGSVTPKKAVERAQEALRKGFKGVANEKLTANVSVYHNVYGQELPYYQVGFFKDNGAYAYGVLISAETAKAVFSARYDQYAAIAEVELPAPEPTPVEPEPAPVEPAPAEETKPAAEGEPADQTQPAANGSYDFSLIIPGVTDVTPTAPETTEAPAEETKPAAEGEPAAEAPVEESKPAAESEPAAEAPASEAGGEMEIAYTGDIELGDVEDIEVTAWTDHKLNCVLYKGKEAVATSGDINHFITAVRPKEAGDYKLVVTVTDAENQTAVQELEFKVAEADTEGILYDIYSQKDGWWTDQSYYTSSMDKDGAALFTLTHALYRIGYDDTSILPENLSQTYEFTQCLTEKGVDNAKLIQAAAKAFGFTTQDKPITDPGKIKELLGKGAVFSFTNAQGNVVLAAGISEDGTLVNIIDANPGASFAEVPADTVFLQQEDGSFAAISSLDEDPYIRWYFNTGAYGGSEYWQKLEDIAPQGLLLIQAKEK